MMPSLQRPASTSSWYQIRLGVGPWATCAPQSCPAPQAPPLCARKVCWLALPSRAQDVTEPPRRNYLFDAFDAPDTCYVACSRPQYVRARTPLPTILQYYSDNLSPTSAQTSVAHGGAHDQGGGSALHSPQWLLVPFCSFARFAGHNSVGRVMHSAACVLGPRLFVPSMRIDLSRRVVHLFPLGT